MKPHVFPAVPQTVPEMTALPLLVELVARHRADRPLAGWRCLFIQHQLGDVCCQAEAMLALGIEPKDFWWAPIPYTAHPAVSGALHARTGVPIGNFFGSTYTLRTNYEEYMKRVITQQVLTVIDGMVEGDRLLVIDDGAYFAAAVAAHPALGARLRRFQLAIVEQTQRGIDKMLAIGLPPGRVPVVDVARSSPKKNIEPRYIAEAVARGTGRAIEAVASPKAGDAVLVMGYGAIGRAVAEALEAIGMGDGLQVWDVRAECADEAHADGRRWWDRSGDATFDYVIGCTGCAAFQYADLVVVRDGALLVNAASGRHELPVDRLLEADEVLFVGDRDAVLDGVDIHAPLHFVLPRGRRMTVANGGLPITFCGDLNPTRPEKFDLTSCCMVYAAVQAVSASEAGLDGLIPLDAAFCRWVEAGWATQTYDD
ncbi:MAG: hypothetical protein H6703_10695 [Myxococcales bacterium]|nr:hypothetical protein [Myxococcales bacterium]